MSSDWIAPAGAAAAVVSSGSEQTPFLFFMLASNERARCLGITLLVKRVPPSRCFPGLLKQTLRLSLRFLVCLVVSVWFLVLDTYINTHTHTPWCTFCSHPEMLHCSVGKRPYNRGRLYRTGCSLASSTPIGNDDDSVNGNDAEDAIMGRMIENYFRLFASTATTARQCS